MHNTTLKIYEIYVTKKKVFFLDTKIIVSGGQSTGWLDLTLKVSLAMQLMQNLDSPQTVALSQRKHSKEIILCDLNNF